MNQTSQPSSEAPGRVECPAAREPAVRKIILAAIFLGFGLWCFSDRAKYPRPAPGEWDVANLNKVAGYILNNWGPAVMVPAGLLILAWTAWGLRRRLVADEDGIGYVGATKIAWRDVQRLDAARLQSKGVLALHYGDGRVLVLDSFYLSNFRDLVAFVERRVPPDRQVL